MSKSVRCDSAASYCFSTSLLAIIMSYKLFFAAGLLHTKRRDTVDQEINEL